MQWLFQQGVLGVVLVLVLIDYRRMYRQLVKKLEYENGTLTEMVRENTASNTELRNSVENLSTVIEELNPRKKWTDGRQQR
jgi:hypothetical protein